MLVFVCELRLGSVRQRHLVLLLAELVDDSLLSQVHVLHDAGRVFVGEIRDRRQQVHASVWQLINALLFLAQRTVHRAERERSVPTATRLNATTHGERAHVFSIEDLLLVPARHPLQELLIVSDVKTALAGGVLEKVELVQTVLPGDQLRIGVKLRDGRWLRGS